MTPVDDKGARPVGRLPAVTLQVYGVAPPVAVNCVEGYGAPTTPFGNDDVVTVGDVTVTVTEGETTLTA
jgi:hypothetical protein